MQTSDEGELRLYAITETLGPANLIPWRHLASLINRGIGKFHTLGRLLKK